MTNLAERRLDDIARRLAEKVEVEPRETEPGLARLQDARDWSAAAGQFELADSQDLLLDMLQARARDEVSRAPAPAVPLQRDRGRELDD